MMIFDLCDLFPIFCLLLCEDMNVYECIDWRVKGDYQPTYWQTASIMPFHRLQFIRTITQNPIPIQSL